MEPERLETAGSRELRLEGVGLVLAGGLLLALLAGAFLLGRWVERISAPPGGGAGTNGPAPLAGVEPDADAERDLTFFDTLTGEGKGAEPQREAVRKPAAADPPAPAPAPSVTPSAPRAAAGPFFVQVFAGRDRAAAESLASSLGAKGYPVRLDAEREGIGSLYKVRVGGFPSREAAAAAVVRLKADGQSGAWITRLD